MPIVTIAEKGVAQVELSVRCKSCSQIYNVTVEAADYIRYIKRAEVIQNIFHYLAPSVRELLISGICPSCWKKIFGAEDTSTESEERAAEE